MRRLVPLVVLAAALWASGCAEQAGPSGPAVDAVASHASGIDARLPPADMALCRQFPARC